MTKRHRRRRGSIFFENSTCQRGASYLLVRWLKFLVLTKGENRQPCSGEDALEFLPLGVVVSQDEERGAGENEGRELVEHGEPDSAQDRPAASD